MIASIRPVALVVDDELLILEMLRSALSQLGFDVVCALNSEQATAAIERVRGRIRLVVQDILMDGDPAGRGMAALVSDRDKDVKIVYISGLSPESIQGIELVPGENFLRKPFTFEQVQSLLGPTGQALDTGLVP